MQDIHEILRGGGASGGGGRLFGDRRLRVAAHGDNHQALSCPRCNSLNTKFCYYNNYNLSQPRFFCKNCRRYWTKGGVLRNVPVGGGCRKSKRPSKRKTTASPPPRSSAGAKERLKSNSRSSSESTSDNAATKVQSTGCCADAVGSVNAIGSEYSSSPLFNFTEQPPATVNSISAALIPTCSGMNANFVPFNSLQAAAGTSTVDPSGVGMFTDMGGFVSLMDGDAQQNLLRFSDVETTPFGMHQQNQLNNQLLSQHLSGPRDWQKLKIDGVGDEWMRGIYDQTVHADRIPNSRTGDEVLAVPDWNGFPNGGVGSGGGHLGMFDLTPGSDWSQSSQWNESDHHLYLPP
ncbi:hypothetical protein V2J09_014905 [Rumex salicifolius]